uniref:Secreted protein n=1 Tax=Ascaris lumbricoides TaxID=6252 RepID=A0A0M3HV90_ASCLU
MLTVGRQRCSLYCSLCVSDIKGLNAVWRVGVGEGKAVPRDRWTFSRGGSSCIVTIKSAHERLGYNGLTSSKNQRQENTAYRETIACRIIVATVLRKWSRAAG